MGGFTIFECVTRPTDQTHEYKGSMDETDFYEYLQALHADYVKNEGQDQRIQSLTWLISYLQAKGIPITNAGNTAAYQFITGDETETLAIKETYFQPIYEEFMDNAKALTLQNFSTDSMELYNLRMYLDNPTQCQIYLNETLVPLDDFIRQLDPNTAYVFSDRTVFAHQ